jgi:nucleosome binding factor SPN SPT16 subunit
MFRLLWKYQAETTIMILVWKDMTSFCRHLHEFWQMQKASPSHRWNKVRDMPSVRDIQLKNNSGGVNRFVDSRGKSIVVPIWKITPPRGIQN